MEIIIGKHTARYLAGRDGSFPAIATALRIALDRAREDDEGVTVKLTPMGRHFLTLDARDAFAEKVARVGENGMTTEDYDLAGDLGRVIAHLQRASEVDLAAKA